MLTPEQLAHREYLASATWQDIRKQVLLRDNNQCQFCLGPGSDVHHKHYKNWGNEKLEDLVTLCRSCHEHWHSLHPKIRLQKALGNRAAYNFLSSLKSKVCREFGLTSDSELYSAMCLQKRHDVCQYAVNLLGFDCWYNQVPDGFAYIKQKQPLTFSDKRSRIKKMPRAQREAAYIKIYG